MKDAPPEASVGIVCSSVARVNDFSKRLRLRRQKKKGRPCLRRQCLRRPKSEQATPHDEVSQAPSTPPGPESIFSKRLRLFHKHTGLICMTTHRRRSNRLLCNTRSKHETQKRPHSASFPAGPPDQTALRYRTAKHHPANGLR